MSTFVLVHGAWHGGWCWDGLAGRLRAAGHDVLAPTLAGLGERTAELAPGIGLSDHADEIAQVLRGLSPPDDVVAVGHAPRLTPQPIRTFEQATRASPARSTACRAGRSSAATRSDSGSTGSHARSATPASVSTRATTRCSPNPTSSPPCSSHELEPPDRRRDDARHLGRPQPDRDRRHLSGCLR